MNQNGSFHISVCQVVWLVSSCCYGAIDCCRFFSYKFTVWHITVILGLPFDLPNVARKMKWKSFRTTTEANMHTGWKATSWVHEVIMRMMVINDFFCLFVYLSIYISWFYVVGGRHMFLHSKWHWTVVRAVVFRRLWGM